MKIIVAPDSFKESLSALDVADAMGRGVAAACADRAAVTVVSLPIADGGEGTVACLVAATGGRTVTSRVTGPLGAAVEAAWGLLGDGRTAVVEMASASGLPLVPPGERDVLRATTAGTGELIAAAMDRGVERILIGIGGSATVDGGVGMAQALGGRFLDEAGRQVGPGGGELHRIDGIDLSALDERTGRTALLVASDVENPLTGPQGAARVFGPQKGATPEQVALLEQGLVHLAERVRACLGIDVEHEAGAGAAGGLGAALMAFLGARLQPGIALVLEAVGYEAHLAGADLVITGEGQLDGSSLHGKATVGVSRRARDAGVPCIAVAGSLEGDMASLRREGIVAAYGLVGGGVTVSQAMARAAELVADRTREAVAEFLRVRGASGRGAG